MMSHSVSNILVPVNGSPHSERAFRWACQMSRQHKAQLRALHVIEVPMSLSIEAEFTAIVDLAETLLSNYEQIAKDERCRGLAAGHLRARQAGPAIVQEAAVKGADLVAIGIPYHPSFGHCSMGETASYIFQHAPCQVMLWRDTALAENLRQPVPAADSRFRRNGR